MNYKPFSKIKNVDDYLGKEIKISGKNAKIVGAILKRNCVYVSVEFDNGTILDFTSLAVFYTATYDGHPVGEKLGE